MVVREFKLPIEFTPIYANPVMKSKKHIFNWVITLIKEDNIYSGRVLLKESGHKKEFVNLGTEEIAAINTLKNYCKENSK